MNPLNPPTSSDVRSDVRVMPRRPRLSRHQMAQLSYRPPPSSSSGPGRGGSVFLCRFHEPVAQICWKTIFGRQILMKGTSRQFFTWVAWWLQYFDWANVGWHVTTDVAAVHNSCLDNFMKLTRPRRVANNVGANWAAYGHDSLMMLHAFAVQENCTRQLRHDMGCH